jgi:hypothetical protein
MKISLKSYSSLLFVLIGIVVVYILLNVLNKKENYPLSNFDNLHCSSTICNDGTCKTNKHIR